MKYRGIVIGCGKIGALLEEDSMRAAPRSHASSLTSNPKTELCGLVDLDENNLSKAGKLFPNTARYKDLSECLAKEKPDIAIVATGADSHADLIEQCAQAGIKMIIGEKPIANSTKDAGRIAKAIQDHNVTFVLNYQRRLFPLFQHAKGKIEKGEIGKAQQVMCLYSNGLYNNGGHSIDSIAYLLGSRITSVSGFLNDKNQTHPPGDKNIDGLLLTESGVTIALQSFDQEQFPIHEFSIFGEKGLFILHEFGYVFDHVSLEPSAITGYLQPTYAHSKRKEDKRSMTADALTEVIAAYEEKRSVTTGIQNGLETFSVLEALSASVEKNGTRIEVAYTN